MLSYVMGIGGSPSFFSYINMSLLERFRLLVPPWEILMDKQMKAGKDKTDFSHSDWYFIFLLGQTLTISFEN